MIINHNLTAMNTQRQYNLNIDGKAKSTEKLSSGYQINRAADNAAGLAISEKMRSQIRGLDKACNNIQDGTSLVQTADGGLNEVHNILARQRELLVQAANDTNTETDRNAIEQELSQLSKEQDRIYDSTEFNAINVFKGKDTILSGPVTKTSVNIDCPINDTQTTTQTSVKWFSKNTPPKDTHTKTTRETQNSFTSSYTENETLNIIEPDGHNIYNEIGTYTTIESKDVYQDITDITYNKQTVSSKYTNLVTPGSMVGSDGYINVKNEAGDLALSCGMSQLGIKVDNNLLSYSVYYDTDIPKNTVTSSDNLTAVTTYDLGNGMTLSQTIELLGTSGSQNYKISYELKNTDSIPHTADVRLAFDTMNTQITSTKTIPSPYDLESDTAKIPVEGHGTDHTALGDISQLYDTWDDSNIVENSIVNSHTGAGFWWNNRSIPANGTVSLGSVTYGPITLKKEPYQETTTITSDHKRKIIETVTTETTVIRPQYMDVQASDHSFDNIPIRLYNLSTKNLKETIGLDQPISAFHASDSLEHMDRVIDKISSVRSYYGSIQNRLSSTYNVDNNTQENTTASESRIRDTDMESELVRNSQFTILQQAGEAMMAQANQSKKGVLDLLFQ